MRYLQCFVALAALLPAALHAQEICYSGNSSFAMSAPEGWRADEEGARRLGICVVYVLKESTFDDSPAVIYPNLVPVPPDSAGNIDLPAFVERDLERFRERASTLKVTDGGSRETGAGLRFVSRRLLEGPRPNEFEEIAYHATEDAVLIAVLSTRTLAALDANRPALLAFLEGIRPLSRAALFAAQLERAKKDVATAAGAKFEGSFVTALASRLQAAMKSCVRPESQGFSAVLQVDAKGILREITFERDDALARCVGPMLRDFRGPRPPLPQFHLQLKMSLKP